MLKIEVHLCVGQSHQIRQHARTPRACFCRFSPEVRCLPQHIRKNGEITDSTHIICCSVRIFDRFTDGRKVLFKFDAVDLHLYDKDPSLRMTVGRFSQDGRCSDPSDRWSDRSDIWSDPNDRQMNDSASGAELPPGRRRSRRQQEYMRWCRPGTSCCGLRMERWIPCPAAPPKRPL